MSGQNFFMQKIPQKHGCGNKLEEKVVPVNSKILGWEEGYAVKYCTECKVYKLNEKYESESPEIIGDLLTNKQAKTNLRNHGSIYHIKYLDEIKKSTKTN